MGEFGNSGIKRMINNSITSKSMTGGPTNKFKIVFLGNQSVGKTCIINRFIYDTFDGKDHPTVGIDFISKVLYFEDRSVRLQLWDTAGQERFRSLIPSYLRDSAVAIIVFDVSSRPSFQDTTKWIEDVRSERGGDVIIFLVGNKIDLADRRQITEQEGERKAKELDVHYMEVSAKSGANVQTLFKNIASLLPGAETANPASLHLSNNNINLTDLPPDSIPKENSKSCSC
eukprot:TRINITY_DN1883_c0_g1_i19.p1 TRINITY_DN1883_c0_g1~~TRINITY_DN1883_c0_g1_i19.p1  ORF type:complete len:229 (+),score=42.88 TRINITY_DN1883_c0_g1_i19:106-792(+)